MYGFEAMTFNIHGGYLEAIVRGHRSGLLTTADYNNLCQCETLDDIKMHLSATEYGPYLQNEPSSLHKTTIVEKCTLKLVDEYKNMLCQATKPLSTFLEYITYGHMIDNVVLIVLGTIALHERDVNELLEKCHPLGMFDSIGTELTRDDHRKLYSSFGLLHPYGHEELAVCEDIDQVRAVMEKYPPYQSIFSKMSYGESQMLDKAFYEEEVKRECLAFESRFVDVALF
ncbi:hypothetical protein IFM89_018322 [Coptis chinensis]|uniref:V-type proton ATPase subunit d2 n=1 Tax=Coptis chinensis TaxID=261450 RepID=A0A835LC56_9MAGN|nr:hypothetical protein IFM89_018322 [Coptis chinensis]